jgi:predicted small integral membrane protein
VVGLIAGIRRVLIVTAQAERSFQWNPQGIELVILIALILVMAVTILIWRRASPTGDGTDGIR